MTMHLSESEIFDYINSNHRKLPADRKAHLDACEFCQRVIKEQTDVHSILIKMESLKIPINIFTFVSPRINKKSVHKKDWLFYITLGTLAIVALLLFFDLGSIQMQTKSNRQEQLKEFFQDKIAIDKVNIEENSEQLYQKFNGIFKAFGKSTYGTTLLFVFCVVLFYLFIDQHFLRKKIHR